MSREIAKEILYDNMSDNTAKHMNDTSFPELEDWIIDAMVEYHEQQVENNDLLHSVSKCACPPLVACEICGEEKNLDGDFWKNKKKHDC